MPPTRPSAALSIRATGPSQATAGATFTYHLVVTNSAESTARDIVVTGQDPPGLEYISSDPASLAPASIGSGRSRQWQMGELQAQGTQTIDVNYRISEPGELRYCIGLSSTNGAPARDCVTTRIVAAPWEVAVDGPTTAEVGSDVTFEIRVVNRSAAAITGLLVTDRFDEGLRHTASASPIERDLVDLPPGATGRLSVIFRVTQPGESCQDVTVTADGGLRSTVRNCLTAAETPAGQAPEAAQPSEPQAPTSSNPPLTVKITGPDRQRVGETARFRIEVTNHGETPIENLEIADNFETSLEPSQATESSTWLKGNSLGWQIAALAPGKTVRRDIEFKCLRQTPRACNRVTVSADGIEPLADEACLEVAAQAEAAATAAGPSAPISVTVADTADPIKVDGDTTYQIVVTNTSAQSAFDVAVTATFGDEVRLVGLSGPVHGTVLPNTVRFEPIREMRAGENPLSYELRVQGARPGTARLRVEATSRGQTKAVSAEQSTEILRPN